MKNVILILGIFCTLFLASCSTTDEVSLAAEYNNAFMDLVNNDVYPANQLSDKTIEAFNETFVLSGYNEVLSADGSVLTMELDEENVNLLFDLMAEQDDLIASKKGPENGTTAERRPCYKGDYRFKEVIGACVWSPGYRCRVICPEESPL